MFSKDIRISFSDCDPAGILFFGNLFGLAHQVFEEFIAESIGYAAYFSSSDEQYPVVQSRAGYFLPLPTGSKATITLRTGYRGGSSFSTYYTFYNEAGEPAAEAEIIHVCTGRNGKSQKPPEALRELLAVHQGPEKEGFQ